MWREIFQFWRTCFFPTLSSEETNLLDFFSLLLKLKITVSSRHIWPWLSPKNQLSGLCCSCFLRAARIHRWPLRILAGWNHNSWLWCTSKVSVKPTTLTKNPFDWLFLNNWKYYKSPFEPFGHLVQQRHAPRINSGTLEQISGTSFTGWMNFLTDDIYGSRVPSAR